jgi:hypothetical protein
MSTREQKNKLLAVLKKFFKDEYSDDKATTLQIAEPEMKIAIEHDNYATTADYLEAIMCLNLEAHAQIYRALSLVRLYAMFDSKSRKK